MPTNPFGTIRQYPGSSGYWAGDPTYGPHGQFNPAYGGYPGATARIAGGFPSNDLERRGSTPNMFGTNPYGYGQPAGQSRMPGSAFGPFGSAGGSAAAPGFQTVSNTKSPIFQSAIEGGLSALNQTGFNPNVNPNVLHSNTKNPAIQAALGNLLNNPNAGVNPTDFTKSGQYQSGINQAYSQADVDKQSNRDQFNSFLNLFNSSTPRVTNNVNQENASIGDWYDPNGVQAKLDTIAAARNRAVNLSGNRALDRIAKNNALLRMTQGDSSYATQQALDTSASVYADEARQQADLARENYLTTKQGQASLLGARNRGNDYLTNRQLQPVDVRNALANSENSRLGQIGSMDLSNNIYTTPAEQANQRASLLSQLTQLDNANNVYSLDNPNDVLAKRAAILAQLQSLNSNNNFYGLQKPYENTSGNNLPPVNISTPTTPQLHISGGHNNLATTVTNPVASPAQQHSAADEIYRQQTGTYPQDDPNVSQASLDRAHALAAQGFISAGQYWYNPSTGQYIDPNTGQPLRNNQTANTSSFGGAQDYYNNLQMNNAINPRASNFGYPTA